MRSLTENEITEIHGAGMYSNIGKVFGGISGAAIGGVGASQITYITTLAAWAPCGFPIGSAAAALLGPCIPALAVAGGALGFGILGSVAGSAIDGVIWFKEFSNKGK